MPSGALVLWCFGFEASCRGHIGPGKNRGSLIHRPNLLNLGRCWTPEFGVPKWFRSYLDRQLLFSSMHFTPNTDRNSDRTTQQLGYLASSMASDAQPRAYSSRCLETSAAPPGSASDAMRQKLVVFGPGFSRYENRSRCMYPKPQNSN